MIKKTSRNNADLDEFDPDDLLVEFYDAWHLNKDTARTLVRVNDENYSAGRSFVLDIPLHSPSEATISYQFDEFGKSMYVAPSGETIVLQVGRTIHHEKGSAWSTERVSNAFMSRIFGFNAASVFLFGSEGLIYEYGGEAWTEKQIPIELDLNDMHGQQREKMVAVGNGGTAFQFDGNSWRSLDFQTQSNFKAVFCRDNGSILVGGDRRTLFAVTDDQRIDIEIDADSVMCFAEMNRTVYLGDDGFGIRTVNDQGTLTDILETGYIYKMSSRYDQILAVSGSDLFLLGTDFVRGYEVFFSKNGLTLSSTLSDEL